MTHTTTLHVGLVPLARTTFDIPLATQVADQARAQLKAAGFLLTGPETLITTLDDVQHASQALADNPPDLLLVFQATFADSTMVMSLAQAIDAPLLLWAVPESPNGSRLRLNSFCGINLAGHALTRNGVHYDYVYAAPDDAAALEKVRTLALAGRTRRLLRHTRVGRIGEHPVGFEPCQVDPEGLNAHFGLEVVSIELQTVFQSAQAINPEDVEAVFENLNARLDDLQHLEPSALRGTLRTYLALRHLAQQEHLNGLAMRCWPEFFTELGCAACGAMSMLSDELMPCSCEADVNGTVTQLMLQYLSGEPAFGSDLVSVDVEKDQSILWHCGLAPLSMADPAVRPKGTIHSNRKLPLLMEFPLKPGRVTIARLSEATGSYRLVVGGGEMLSAPLSFSGTSGVLRFDRPASQVLDTILQEGLDHHFCLTYGDYVSALQALSKMLNLSVLCL